MELVKLTEAHIPQMVELEKICFSLPWTADMIRSELNNPSCLYLAAVDGDTLVGYIGVQTVLDEGYINNVAVRPEYRRQGIAAALISLLVEQARAIGLAFMTLEVRESNAPAISLYEKLGFTTVGRRKNYYEKPREDAILMTIFFTKE
ncbi:MAG: ribosomal protein S18-alanine N-acetyltransferase [Oscillospiraceae bacterium]|nr:ribosomal protein S18-alanine N-acetyltransferase [Oscillospiraceae bacterium]